MSIIGAGTMGHSIALSIAWVNYSVVVFAISDEEVQSAKVNVEEKLQTLIETQVITTGQAVQIMNCMEFTTELEECLADTDYVIEAVPEQLILKQDIFAKIEQLIAPSIPIASNTSGIPSKQLIAKLAQPERFIITHFWNPAHLIPLVEVVPSSATNDVTMNKTLQLLKHLRKKPIVIKKELQGFIGNRLQFALYREAQYLLDEGIASKEDIDTAITHSIARRLPITGPLMSADLTGLDVVSSICSYLYEDLCNETYLRPVTNKLVDQQKLGLKSSEGFYQWPTEKAKAINKQREQLLIDFLKKDLTQEGIT
ncbi:3-hydroxyacyl-CoA dehydrogenase family protein [Lysinibacillus sp. NPDC096418]|uniref:3-hydroxyacyl-CoA dehydrogenase family protein n=1 Tax=Lysinibacillus sp. NPDC096418 TaxID=3364138 RepID=UPI003813C3A6